MPIYEYKCNNCHHNFELMQKISESPADSCPSCSKNTVVRLISAPNFQLKGTGWYVTDFKDAKKQAKSDDTKKVEKTSTEEK